MPNFTFSFWPVVQNLARSQKRHPTRFLLPAALVLLLCLPGLLRLGFDPSLAKLGTDQAADFAVPGEILATVATSANYLGLLEMLELSNTLSRIPGLRSVRPPVSRQILDLGPEAAMQQLALVEAMQGSPVFASGPGQGSWTIMYIRTIARPSENTASSATSIELTIEHLHEALSASGHSFRLTGLPLVEHKLATKYPAALLFFLQTLFLLALFSWRLQSLRAALLAAAPGLFAAGISLGALGWAGASLDLLSLAAPQLLVLLGSLAGLSCVQRVQKLLRQGSGIGQSIRISQAQLLLPLGACFLLVLGVLATLLVQPQAALRSLALLLLFGLILAALAYSLLLPPLLLGLGFALRKNNPVAAEPRLLIVASVLAGLLAGPFLVLPAPLSALSQLAKQGGPQRLSLIVPPGQGSAPEAILSFQAGLLDLGLPSQSPYSVVRAVYADMLGQPQHELPQAAASSQLVLQRIQQLDPDLLSFLQPAAGSRILVQTSRRSAETIEQVAQLAKSISQIHGVTIIPQSVEFSILAANTLLAGPALLAVLGTCFLVALLAWMLLRRQNI